MADKEYYNVDVPVYSNPLRPQTVRVRFKYDTPRVSAGDSQYGGTYTRYNWGVFHQTDPNDAGRGLDGYLSGFDGLFRALTNLDGVPNNDDGQGGPLKPYTVKAGTVVDIGCLQTNPNDNKTKRYGAVWVSGPVQEYVEGGQQQTAPPPAPQPQTNGAAPKGEQMFSQDEVRNSKKYQPMTDEQHLVAKALIKDRGTTLVEAIEFVEENFPNWSEVSKQKFAVHLNMEVATNLWRYDGMASDEAPAPAGNGHADPIMQQLGAIAGEPVAAKRNRMALDFFIANTDTENDFSIRKVLNDYLGIRTMPTKVPEEMYKIYQQVNTYYEFRLIGGHEPDEAAKLTREKYS